MTTTEVIREFIVAEYLSESSPDELDPDYDLLATGVIDSLGLLRLIAWLTEEFGVPVDDLDIAPEHFRSVSAISGFIEAAAGAAGADAQHPGEVGS